MKKTVHIKPQNRLFAGAVAVVFLISFALLGICQLEAGAFYGALQGISANADGTHTLTDDSTTTEPPTTQPPTTDEAGVADAQEKLPQSGGISSSTMIGLFGLALIVSGCTAVTILKKKNSGKSK